MLKKRIKYYPLQRHAYFVFYGLYSNIFALAHFTSDKYVLKQIFINTRYLGSLLEAAQRCKGS